MLAASNFESGILISDRITEHSSELQSNRMFESNVKEDVI